MCEEKSMIPDLHDNHFHAFLSTLASAFPSEGDLSSVAKSSDGSHRFVIPGARHTAQVTGRGGRREEGGGRREEGGGRREEGGGRREEGGGRREEGGGRREEGGGRR